MFSRKRNSPPAAAEARPSSDAAEEPKTGPLADVDAAAAADDDDDDDDVPADLAQARSTAPEDIVYPSGLKLALLLSSIFISMFLVALDRLIIATAIPQITDDFHSVTDIGWYGSAYLLATCAFQLLFGKLYTFYSVKAVFLSTVFLFEVGSAICGAAPNSVAFILGRAISGVGAAGIFSGVIVVLVYAVPLHKRPLYQGIFGAVFGIASVIGPLLGGVFTTKVTWRWCFYINLPFGAVAMLFIFLLLRVPDRHTTKLPTREKLSQLDAPGTGLIMPGSVCLLLALQWGGLEYPWNDGRIIALLVLAAVLLIGFVLVQVYLPRTATIPPRIFMQRSILAGFWSTFCVGSQMMVFVYFLPIWFQAIQGVSAVDSGIRTLPLVLAMVVASMSTGILVSRIGYYTPVMIVGVCIMSVGAGLLTTLQLDTPESQWIGYQVLYGFGIGCTFQAPNLAAQTVLPVRDVAVGTSLMFFSQLLGGAIFISVGQNVLDNQLIQRLSSVPGFSPAFIKNSGATSFTDLPDGIRQTVLLAYNEALRTVFQVGLVLVCLTIFGALALEWRSVKKNLPAKKPAAASTEEEGRAAGAAAAAPAGAAAEKRLEAGEDQAAAPPYADGQGQEAAAAAAAAAALAKDPATAPGNRDSAATAVAESEDAKEGQKDETKP